MFSGAAGTFQVRVRLNRCALAFLASLTFAAPSRAQVVRGDVSETGGGPISGVLVQLMSPDTSTVLRSVLSDGMGRFQVIASSPGRYVLQAKRIGVQRWVSDPFPLSAGQAHEVSIHLATLAAKLPEIVVRSTSQCVKGGEDAQMVASLWEEINVALTATALTVEDSAFRATIVRSSRVLDPRTRRVLAERRHQVEQTTGRPFSTIEPESLLTNGYWQDIDESAATFFGLDERVLNSDAFRAANCFSVAARPERGRGSIGLGFEPVRTGNGVRGTIWLDSATFVLREVDYHYTGLTRTEHSEHLGGVTRFGQLTSGGWIVREWSILMPQYAVFRTPTGFERMYSSGLGSAVRVPRIQRFIEQGGSVHSDQLITTQPPGSIRGIVHDSLGRPVGSAAVSLLGTAMRTITTSDGTFELPAVPEGYYALAANDSASADLGVHAAEHDIRISPGDSIRVTLRFRKGRELMMSLCKREDIPPDRAALRLRLVDSVSNQPLAGREMRLWWTEYTSSRGFRKASTQAVDAVTSGDGDLLVCGLPAGTEINIGTALDHSRARPVGGTSLLAGSIRSIVLRSQ